MRHIDTSSLLRTSLRLDAITCAAVAALQLGLTSTLNETLGLAAPLLWGSGLFLVAYAVLLIAMQRATRIPRPLLLVVVAGNVAWGLGCLDIAVTRAFGCNTLGQVYLVVQAVSVFALAALQWRGGRSVANRSGQPA